MNAQTATKMENKGNVKSNTVKSTSQDKVIDKLRQELAVLTKTVTTLQKKRDIQRVIVTMANEMFNETNQYIAEVSQDIGRPYDLSEFIGDAVYLYLDAAKANKRLAEERRLAELTAEKKA